MKELIIEILKFVKESTYPKIAIAVFGLPGTGFIVFAIIGKLAAWAGMGLGARYAAFVCGAMGWAAVLVVIFFQFSFNKLKFWLKKQFVEEAIA